MREYAADREIIDWLNDGPGVAPYRLVQDTFAYIDAHPHRTGRSWSIALRLPTLARPGMPALRLLFILLIVALLSALLGVYVGAQLWREPHVIPQPSELSGPLTLLAVSSDEAWVGGVDAAGADAVWHVVGAASSVVPVPTHSFTSAQPYPFDVTIQQLLRTPDGSLWATDGAHNASVLQGTTWTSVGVGAHGVALDGDGMVWVAEDDWTGWAAHAYALTGNGTWVERAKTSETTLAAFPTHIAVGHDGTIWAGNTGAADPAASDGLLRYSATRFPPSAISNPVTDPEWQLVNPLGGRRASVSDLAVAPNGDVWFAIADRVASGQLGHPWIARFDGTTWAVFRPPAQGQGFGLVYENPTSAFTVPAYNALAIGPDGTVWVASDRGLFRYDGRAWTVPYPGVWFTDVSVADDGTVWMIGPSGVTRLDVLATPR